MAEIASKPYAFKVTHMHAQKTLLAVAVLSALASTSRIAHAQTASETLPEVRVTSSPFSTDESSQILTPAKVLRGDELRNKLGSSLGETLTNEVGVSASGFGPAASRPIIRGLGGPRVRVMQNGMGVSDLSTISEDHAVGAAPFGARQIEILRGPAALLYGSGAIGGLVNVINDRIPTELSGKPRGEAEARFGTADRSRGLSLSADGSAGKVGLHFDGNFHNADDYRIPGNAVQGDPSSATGRLPLSFTRQNNLGVGASYVERWGHVGASISSFNNRYGIPSGEGAQIDLQKMRYDVDALVRKPFEGVESIGVKLGYTDYRHVEFDALNVPENNFTNRALESRWELAHREVAGWRGRVGVQSEQSRLAGTSVSTGAATTVPSTRSQSLAAFVVEEKEFGPVRVNAGLRLESVTREPVGGLERSFDLSSYSIGGLWAFMPGYGFGSTYSIAQRAPSTEELYSNGPHHATETYDRGTTGLKKEASRNLELTLQKTEGPVRWRTNLFQNKFKNFIYGQLTGLVLDENGAPGGDLNERIFSQANATIRGAEAEVSYNLRGEGLSARAFADTSRGRLDNASNLPLQPANRVGLELGFKQGPWNSGASVLRAQRQARLASFETSTTPGYTRVDASFSYTQRQGQHVVTWFVLGKNLLNEDIRLSTSLLKDFAPLQGRSLVLGVRSRF